MSLSERLEATTLQVDDLLAYAQRGRIRLPGFQRLLRWTGEDARALLDSLYRGYPAGTLVLHERQGDAGSQVLGGYQIQFGASSAAWFVVDGQQRITTLVACLLGGPEASEPFRVGFALEEDAFVPWADDRDDLLPLWMVADTLELLAWQRTLAGPKASAWIRRSDAVAKALREYRFPASIVRTDSDETLGRVFQRLNTSGHPLSRADVVHALEWSSRRRHRKPSLGGWAIARSNVRTDVKGDWVPDPFGWPELLLGSDTQLERRDEDLGTRPVLSVDVPKSLAGRRPAVLLDPLDRVVYQRLVDALSPGLHADLPDSVCGWRQSRKRKAPGAYAGNGYEWRRYSRQREGLGRSAWILETDIQSFFHSVSLPSLERVVRLGADRRSLAYKDESRLMDLLRGWNDVPFRGGLPQRCLASSVLAQAVLADLDQVLASHGRPWTRWMDDVLAEVEDESAGLVLLGALRAALDKWGLDLAAHKTTLHAPGEGPGHVALEGTELDLQAEPHALFARLRAVEPSGPEDQPARTPPIASQQARRALEHHVRQNPLRADPHAVSKVLKLLRVDSARFDLDAWSDTLTQLFFAANHVAFLLRERVPRSQRNAWVQAWFSSPWAHDRWARATMVRAIPVGTASAALRRQWADALAAGALSPVEVAAVCRHLAAKPQSHRRALRQAAETSGDPYSTRWLALAALEADPTPAGLGWTQEVLGRWESWAPLAEVLRDRGVDAVLTWARKHP